MHQHPDSTVLAVRPALAADCTALCSFINSADRGESSKAGWSTEADLLDGQRVDADGLRDAIGKQGSVVLLHEAAGEIVACVALDRRARDCHLGMLTVRPTRQSTGLGRRLGLCQAALRNNYSKCYISPLIGPPALPRATVRGSSR